MKSLNGHVDVEGRLDEIRQISNVVQALENLSSQLENVTDFEDMKLDTARHLQTAALALRRKIHSPLDSAVKRVRVCRNGDPNVFSSFPEGVE